TTSPNPIVSAPTAKPTEAPAHPAASAEVAKPRKSRLRLVLSMVAVVFVLFIVGVIGVIWYVAHSTRSAPQELDKAMKDATADMARESAGPQEQPGSSTPPPGTHLQHKESPRSEGHRPGTQPP